MYELLLTPFWDQKGWNAFKPEVEQLANSLCDYSDLLRKQQLRMKAVRAFPAPVRTLSDCFSVKFLKKSWTSNPLYGELNSDVLKVSAYHSFLLCKYLPEDKNRKYTYMCNLSENILQKCLLITDRLSNNVGNAYFFIPVQDADSEDARLEKSQSALEEIKKALPENHTQEIRRTLFKRFGRISNHVKPYSLRYVCWALTGDRSAPAHANEVDIERRVVRMVEMEDLDIVPDLRVHNVDRKAVFDPFLSACKQALDEKFVLAVDDRRHDDIQYKVSVVFVPNLW